MTRIIIALLMIVSICVLFSHRSALRKNEIILQDSIHILKNKIGDVVYKSEMKDKSLSELKRENKDLYIELKKYNGKPKEIIKWYPKIEYKDQIIRDTVYSEIKDSIGIFNIKFDLKEYYTNRDYLILSGTSSLKIDFNNKRVVRHNTVLNDLSISASVYHVETDGGYHIRSDFPNLTISEIQSINLTPKKKKKFGFSVFGGPAIMTDLSNASFGLCVGVGITYDIWQF